MKESEIRKLISNNLQLLDSSLVLVKEEYPILFNDGRRAFVDILCKDAFGCFTVIEPKKSNQTARSAIQQMYKYASFLKEKNRIEASQIRCFIVSTVWDELLAPFSEFDKFSDYETKGFKVIFDSEMIPQFENITPHFVTGDSKPLSSFMLFNYECEESRNIEFNIFTSVLDMIPSMNSALYKLDSTEVGATHGGAYGLDENPYCFAWIIFTGNVEKIINELEVLDNESATDNSPLDVFLARWESEHKETHLRSKIIKIFLGDSSKLKQFKGYAPHTLNNLFSFCNYHTVVSKGPMFEDGLFDEDDVANMSCGVTGLHPYIFIAKATPSRPVHFHSIREEVEKFLVSNNRWKEGLNHIFTSLDENDNVQINIYNPLNIFGLINDTFVRGSSTRIPKLDVLVTKENGGHKLYYGAMYWDSSQTSMKARDAILSSYPNLNVFRVRSVFNDINQFDEKLSSLYGLNYKLLDLTGKRIFSEEHNGEWAGCDFDSLKNLQYFIESNEELVIDVGELFTALKIGVGNNHGMVAV